MSKLLEFLKLYSAVGHQSHGSHGSHSSHSSTSHSQTNDTSTLSGASVPANVDPRLSVTRYNNLISSLNKIRSAASLPQVSTISSGAKATAASYNAFKLQLSKKVYATSGSTTYYDGLQEGGTGWLDIPGGANTGAGINSTLSYDTMRTRINNAISSGIPRHSVHTSHSDHGSHSSHGSHSNHDSHTSHSDHSDHSSHGSTSSHSNHGSHNSTSCGCDCTAVYCPPDYDY